MIQPEDFGFGTEEQMLKSESRRFFKKHCDTVRLMDLFPDSPVLYSEPECYWDEKTWEKMIDLGWTSLAVPERASGVGMKAVAVAALVEEAGRAAFPSPLLSTINASYLLSCCETEAADRILTQIADGKTASLAVMDRNGSWIDPENSPRADGAGRLLLNGTSWFVQDARKVDFFVLLALIADCYELIAVPKEAQGLRIVPDTITDLTRDQAHLEFTEVELNPDWILSQPGTGSQVLARVEPLIHTMIAADMCGAGEWQLQATVEYAKNREQFGKPIGFYQAVKHPIVDMMIRIDEARSLLYNAACAIDHEPDQAATSAHMAKAAAADMAAFTSDRSIQFHGGYGFTWEASVHVYFKRQLHHRTLFGDARYHRARLSDIVMGPVGG